MELDVAGTEIFAATGGRVFQPRKPTILFLHGAGMDHTVWTLQTRWFAHHGRNVLAIDLPGHGRSGGTALGSIGDLADFVPRLLDAAGAADAALVGHSMGALVALEAAARHPARVRALALLGIAATMPVHPKLLAAAAANDPAAAAMIVDWGFGQIAQLGGAQAPGTWMTGGGAQLLARAKPGALGTDLAACDAYKGAVDAAAKVEKPVLYLLGAADKMTPAKAAQSLIAATKKATLEILPGTGHMMMVERPDATLDAIARVC
jgi:pimeloyl-ACP methyl ester carboxylesterase